MNNIMLVSMESYSGKTGLAISLVSELRARGRRACYFKPVGNQPVEVDSIIADQDALFAADVLGLDEPPGRLCPVVLTSLSATAHLRGDGVDDAVDQIRRSYKKLMGEYELLVIEGSGHINHGRLHEVSAPQLAKELGARVIMMVKLDNTFEVVDDMLVVADRFGDRLAGAIFNWANPAQERLLRDVVIPFLERQGIGCFGVIPRDEHLQAVTVDSLAKALGGRYLCGREHGQDMVESFMVGAMGQEQALRFFKRKSHKAVVTGGDRADVQLAALETATACLILTGNYPPAPAVLSVAQSKGVPVLLVDADTMTAVEQTESLIGRSRVHDIKKLKEIAKKVESYVDIDALLKVAS